MEIWVWVGEEGVVVVAVVVTFFFEDLEGFHVQLLSLKRALETRNWGWSNLSSEKR